MGKKGNEIPARVFPCHGQNGNQVTIVRPLNEKQLSLLFSLCCSIQQHFINQVITTQLLETNYTTYQNKLIKMHFVPVSNFNCTWYNLSTLGKLLFRLLG